MANNGTNTSDKVQESSKVIPTMHEFAPVHDGLYMVVADTIDRTGTRFLTEGFEVQSVGVVQRDTVFDERGVTANVTMIPGVRIVVHRDKDGEKDGFEYIGIHSTTLDEARSSKQRLR